MTATSARARHYVALSRRRRFFGPLTRVLNPLIRRLAGGSHTPLFSLVFHQGRRSGRTYSTPVGLGSTGETFLIPLTFGVDADWCRNVLAAGRCLVTSHGRNYVVLQPEVVNDLSVPAELSAAFDPIQRQALRIMGTHTFLRLRVADPETSGRHSGCHPASHSSGTRTARGNLRAISSTGLLELKADDIDVAAFGAFLDSDRHSNARLGAAEPAAADPLEIARACVPTLDLADAIERRHSRRSGWTVRLQKAWRVPRPASPLASPNTTLGN
jgi:deazaflavin-dependent oxidoreductase (nitroreductase family)